MIPGRERPGHKKRLAGASLFSAAGEIRTRTQFNLNQALNLARLPVPPPRRVMEGDYMDALEGFQSKIPASVIFLSRQIELKAEFRAVLPHEKEEMGKGIAKIVQIAINFPANA